MLCRLKILTNLNMQFPFYSSFCSVMPGTIFMRQWRDICFSSCQVLQSLGSPYQLTAWGRITTHNSQFYYMYLLYANGKLLWRRLLLNKLQLIGDYFIGRQMASDRHCSYAPFATLNLILVYRHTVFGAIFVMIFFLSKKIAPPN